jgi:hypothetical protein
MNQEQINVQVTGLAENTKYYFRVCASNSKGETESPIVSFTTSSLGSPPAVTTLAATSVGATAATLNGNVIANGLATNAWFEYGTDPTLASSTSTSSQSVGSGTTSQSVNAALTGLSTGTTYYYRVAASNGSGTTKGSILSFTPGAVPGVTTLAATSVGATAATLNGNVIANGLSTTAWFEWGTNSSLSSFTSTSSQSVGSGTTSQSVNAALTGLNSGATYYYRVAASNSAGESKGTIFSFSTTQPAVVRVLYVMPQDRTLRSDYYAAVADAPVDLQGWYQNQLGGKTFSLFSVQPETCLLPQGADYYASDSWTKVMTDVQTCAPVSYNSSVFVWVLYIDVIHACNAPGRLGAGTSGVTMLPRQDMDGLIGAPYFDDCGVPYDFPPDRYIGGLGHELGHAFGLPHPPGCEEGLPTCDYNALMWAGFWEGYPSTTYLRAEEKQFLLESPFFW